MTAILALDVGTTSIRAAIVDGDLRDPGDRPAAVPAGDAVPGARRVRCRRARPASCSTPPPRPSPPPASRSRAVGHHEPAGQHDRVGPGHGRADRPGARLAGPAHRRRVPRCCAPSTTSRWPPTSRPRSWPGSSPTRPGAARPRPRASAPSTRGWRGSCRAARSTSPTRRTPPSPGSSASTGASWNEHVLDLLDVPPAHAAAHRRHERRRRRGHRRSPARPPIAALVGDQQASLVGQGCVTPGRAKITFGTGGILDVCRGAGRPDLGPPRRARLVPGRRLVARRRGRRGAPRRSCSPPA